MKILFKLTSILFIVFCLVSIDITDTYAASIHSVQALQMLLKSKFKIKADDVRKSISYCPNETCDVIQAPTAVSYQEIGDFSYLYLFYFSAYSELNKKTDESESFRVAGKKFIKAIAERNRGECQGQNEKELTNGVIWPSLGPRPPVLK